MSEATKDLGLDKEEPTKERPFSLEDHAQMFVAGAKDFAEDMRSVASGNLTGPSMKHRSEYIKSRENKP